MTVILVAMPPREAPELRGQDRFAHNLEVLAARISSEPPAEGEGLLARTTSPSSPMRPEEGEIDEANTTAPLPSASARGGPGAESKAESDGVFAL